jgi:nucleotide-binding universal stress UspA family protein
MDEPAKGGRMDDSDSETAERERAARRGDGPAARAQERRTVIVPLPPVDIDPAHAAEAALPVARTVAERTKAGVTLLSVVALTPPFNPLTEMATPAAPVPTTSHVADAEAQLAGLAAAFPSTPVKTVVRAGEVAAEIRAVASQHAQPLLVLCSHTRTGLDRLLFGSVTGELVRTAPCPVLVVRGSLPTALEGTLPLRTVVVPLDRSSLAEQAVPRALSALGPPDLHLHLLHVREPQRATERGSPSREARDEPEIRRYLEAIARRLGNEGYRVTTEVRAGRPAEEIAKAASEQGAQLIAMATHGRGGVHPVLLGSVAERLLQSAPVPLLFVRPADSGSNA